MRAWQIAGFVLLVAVPVSADPIQYTFIGTLGRTSSLTRSDGTVIDLTGASFTASGSATGALAEGWTQSVFLATTTYDFADFGAFTTDANDDRYVQFDSDDHDGTGFIGLEYHLRFGSLNDTQGFVVQVPVLPVVDGALLTTTDGPVTLSFRGTSGSQTRTIINTQGERFRIAYDVLIPFTITSADVRAVPEPATLVLIAAAGVFLRRHHKDNRSNRA